MANDNILQKYLSNWFRSMQCVELSEVVVFFIYMMVYVTNRINVGCILFSLFAVMNV